MPVNKAYQRDSSTQVSGMPSPTNKYQEPGQYYRQDEHKRTYDGNLHHQEIYNLVKREGGSCIFFPVVRDSS
jgi:hypothetical protein